MTEEFLKEAEGLGLITGHKHGGFESEPIILWTLTGAGEQWLADTLALERGKHYDQAARAFETDLYSKLSMVTVRTATWADRCEDGWDDDLLRTIITRTFDGKETKVTNWLSIRRYLAEKSRGIDTALIYAGQFEQRVMEELGC